jgi:hypothetical protein
MRIYANALKAITSMLRDQGSLDLSIKEASDPTEPPTLVIRYSYMPGFESRITGIRETPKHDQD